MSTQNTTERSLKALRTDQVDKILEGDDFLATEVLHLREELSQYGIVLARRKPPGLSKTELQRLRRQRHADAGLCKYSALHGKATHGTYCTPCYEVNQKNLKDRRAKARKANARKAKGVTPNRKKSLTK